MTTTGRTSTNLGFRIPGLGWRITLGALRMIPLVLLLVGLPAALLTYLSTNGVALPLSILTVTIFGVLISALSTARYISKPYRAYGPVSVAASAVTIVYILVLLAQSTYTIAIPNTPVTLTLSYTELIELLLIVPLLSMTAAVVTAIEDARSLQERLPFDFPP
ncbi:MAG TPA: hypothetical protein VK424_04235 [Thermoplasmata archaeon]|nr:hypothetical protein [Thermoplasmata archaeon]